MTKASDRLYQMIGGFRETQMVRAAALLGICDALANGPRAAADVAADVTADPGLLYRLMRALAGLGILREEEDGRFTNTDIGELLKEDALGSMRNAALGIADSAWWQAWAELPRAIREGAVPFELAHGRSWWDMVAADRETGDRFNAFMAAQTRLFVPQLLEIFDFSRSKHVVDIGGGTGALIAAVLSVHRSTRGTLFDLEAGLQGADDYLREQGVRDRCDIVAGSFFKSVPESGDVYVLRQILHDWDDQDASEILHACRRGMTAGATLLVIDQVLPIRAVDAPRERLALTFDIHMHVLFGARERTEASLREILERTGFRVERLAHTSPASTIVALAT